MVYSNEYEELICTKDNFLKVLKSNFGGLEETECYETLNYYLHNHFDEDIRELKKSGLREYVFRMFLKLFIKGGVYDPKVEENLIDIILEVESRYSNKLKINEIVNLQCDLTKEEQKELDRFKRIMKVRKELYRSSKVPTKTIPKLTESNGSNSSELTVLKDKTTSSKVKNSKSTTQLINESCELFQTEVNTDINKLSEDKNMKSNENEEEIRDFGSDTSSGYSPKSNRNFSDDMSYDLTKWEQFKSSLSADEGYCEEDYKKARSDYKYELDMNIEDGHRKDDSYKCVEDKENDQNLYSKGYRDDESFYRNGDDESFYRNGDDESFYRNGDDESFYRNGDDERFYRNRDDERFYRNRDDERFYRNRDDERFYRNRDYGTENRNIYGRSEQYRNGERNRHSKNRHIYDRNKYYNDNNSEMSGTEIYSIDRKRRSAKHERNIDYKIRMNDLIKKIDKRMEKVDKRMEKLESKIEKLENFIVNFIEKTEL